MPTAAAMPAVPTWAPSSGPTGSSVDADMISAATAHACVIGVYSHADSTKSSRLSPGQGERCGQVQPTVVIAVCAHDGKGSPRQTDRARHQAEHYGRHPRALGYPDAQAAGGGRSRGHRGDGQDKHPDGISDDLGRAAGPAKVGEQEAGQGRGQGPSGMAEPL